MAILSKLVIGVSGTLPHEPQQIKKWVEANGGRWAVGSKKGATLTHLIASKDAWKKAGDDVQKAADNGVCIVSYDWLEDSLQGKRKLSEKKYTWEHLRKEKKKQKKIKRIGLQLDGMSIKAPITRKPKKSSAFFFKSEKVPDTPFQSATEALKQKREERGAANHGPGCSVQAPTEIEDEDTDATLSEVSPSPSTSAPKLSPVSASAKPTSSSFSSKAATVVAHEAKTPHIKDLYHYYLDATGFEYKIVLVRSHFSTNSFARYHIGLLESHAKPHTYCTVVQYTPPAKQAPEPSAAPAAPRPELKNPLLNFLRKNEKPAIHQSSPVINSINTARQPLYHPDEPTRLTSLITPPTPIPIAPFKTLICPMNSPYSTAYRAFRHAFRDLTLLTWEERFDPQKTTQKARARTLDIEPFLYAKPGKGLPIGLLPQEVGYLVGETGRLDVTGEAEERYVRNAWKLPGLDAPLSKNGAIGAALHRDEQARRKKEEEERAKVEEEEEQKRRARGEASRSQRQAKVNHNKPMFNGVRGTPTTDYSQYTVGTYGRGIYRQGLFPSERAWE